MEKAKHAPGRSVEVFRVWKISTHLFWVSQSAPQEAHGGENEAGGKKKKKKKRGATRRKSVQILQPAVNRVKRTNRDPGFLQYAT